VATIARQGPMLNDRIRRPETGAADPLAELRALISVSQSSAMGNRPAVRPFAWALTTSEAHRV